MKIAAIFCLFVFSLGVGFAVSYGDLSLFYDTVAYAPRDGANSLPLSGAPGMSDGIVNINTANAEELDTLYGIGEKYAGRIISYRQENGRFEVIQDILKVPGIGEKRFLDIKDKITVE